ncbi:MAG: hypothetical protein ACI4D8_01170 [Wujia sp.]
MKILFLDAKDYDRIWFDPVAREKGFQVSYTEKRIDLTGIEDLTGYQVICTDNISKLDKATEERLAEAGIKAILYRGKDMIKYSGRLPIMQIDSFTTEDIISKKWQSYLP